MSEIPELLRAAVLEAGDHVLLTVPDGHSLLREREGLIETLNRDFPGVDFVLIAGAEAFVQKEAKYDNAERSMPADVTQPRWSDK